jgi:hypothetical protein
MGTEPLYAPETAILQRIAHDPECRFIWKKHAKEQMEARGINASDVMKVLTKGRVIFHELKRDLLWRVEGRDIDGRRLQVQVAVYEDAIAIKIVTAF